MEERRGGWRAKSESAPPIRLAAERMRRRASARDVGATQGPKFVEEGASTIIEEVSLARLVDSSAGSPAAGAAPSQRISAWCSRSRLWRRKPGGLRGPADLPAVRADAEQVKRALINLVDNAVAATPAGGHVGIVARVAGGRATVVVSDDGPGIPAADLERVFDPAFSTKARGTGLGLAITARIAAEHSGRVRVEENVPHGCRFILEWPAA
jgi:signal transduction histidine kinase